jgi:hypothetical protein
MTLQGGTAANGTWKFTWPLWVNGTNAPVSWTFHATAFDAAGNQISSVKTVVVGQKLSKPDLMKLGIPR